MLNTNVSFGHTVKVNAPLRYAVKLEKMINNPEEYPNEKEVTEKLKDTFDDVTPKGKAIAFSDGPNRSYILTGKESEEAAKIKDGFTESVRSLDSFCQGGTERDFAHIMLCDRFNSDIKSLISRTKANSQIYITGVEKNYRQNITSISVEG